MQPHNHPQVAKYVFCIILMISGFGQYSVRHPFCTIWMCGEFLNFLRFGQERALLLHYWDRETCASIVKVSGLQNFSCLEAQMKNWRCTGRKHSLAISKCTLHYQYIYKPYSITENDKIVSNTLHVFSSIYQSGTFFEQINVRLLDLIVSSIQHLYLDKTPCLNAFV